MYNKETEPCSAEAKCDFRSFRAVQSFWTKQQSFISKKIAHQKWCPFFDFVCFSRCHFTKTGLFQKQIGNMSVFLALCMYLIAIIDNSSIFCWYIFVLEVLAFFPTMTILFFEVKVGHFSLHMYNYFHNPITQYV